MDWNGLPLSCNTCSVAVEKKLGPSVCTPQPQFSPCHFVTFLRAPKFLGRITTSDEMWFHHRTLTLKGALNGKET
jgi:hypothetical protein